MFFYLLTETIMTFTGSFTGTMRKLPTAAGTMKVSA